MVLARHNIKGSGMGAVAGSPRNAVWLAQSSTSKRWNLRRLGEQGQR